MTHARSQSSEPNEFWGVAARSATLKSVQCSINCTASPPFALMRTWSNDNYQRRSCKNRLSASPLQRAWPNAPVLL